MHGDSRLNYNAACPGRPLPRMTSRLASSEHKANPCPYYERLRAESPVHRVMLPGRKTAWLVTRYADAESVLKDTRFVKDRFNVSDAHAAAWMPWMPGFVRPLTRNMLDVDNPDHARLRSIVSKAFTPPRIEQMRNRIETLADDLLTAAQARQHLDLIRDFARPIPTTIIAEMLGVPIEDRGRFTTWSSAIVAADSSKWATLRAIPNLWLFIRYLRGLIEARRTDPQDDLLSALIEAEEAGQRLNEDELLAMVFLLLVAGHETTVNLIGNGALALWQHPDQLARLRDNPGLIRPAVEELLRYSGPLELATERYAREDLAIAGVAIPRGSLVFAAIASANRDDRQFSEPDTLDITREPNKHLAFGHGAHFCLGASLARMEGQIAIGALVRRAVQWRPAVEPAALRWRRGFVLRGLKSLPLTVSKWA